MINWSTATRAMPLRKSLRRVELATFLVALFMVAAMALPRMAAAISFGVLGVDSGPCTFSSGLDAGGFCQDIGIDYNPLFDNLVTSVHYTPFGGFPNAFDYIDRTTGARTPIGNPVITNVGDERKLAVVRQVQGVCTQQWPVGTIFSGNGTPGQLMKINPDGTFLNPWKVLPGEGGIVRGGIYHDRWCVAGGDVIVVTGTSNPNDTVGGTVWRVPEVGAPTLLQTILHPGPVSPIRAHLEGVITVPFASQFGPWAGKILTGDEARVDLVGQGELNGPNPKIYTIDPTTGVCDQNSTATNSPSCNATFTFTGVVPNPEDFDFIEGDFYGVAYRDSNSSGDPTKSPDGYILQAPRGQFPAQVDPFPDILITQEYPVNQPTINQIPAVLTPLGTHSGLYQIRYVGSNTFTATELQLQNAPQYTQWEHVTLTSPRARIAIAPNATNEVGASHTFTVTFQKDVGAGFVAAAGEHVDVVLSNSNGANFTNVSGTCTNAGANTNASGQCTITFTSNSPGKVTGHASATLGAGPGAGIHVETDGTFLNSGDAVKTFVDANIQITPATATNPVNTNHTLTAHVNINDGSGFSYTNAPAGTLITFSIQSGPGSFVSGINTCTTIGATGSCSVQITSATAGTTVVRASTTVNVGGVLLTRTTGDGKAGDSLDANKTWQAPAARISIAPNATNEVGVPHTFTVTLEKDLTGTGTFVAASGEHVDVTLTDANGAVHTAPTGTCTNAGANTNAAGQCTITFNSNTAGTVTGSASSNLVASGTTLTVSTNGANGNSGPAVKTYVDANIQITPATATNPISTNHTLTGHVNVNAGGGAGFVNAPVGTLITFSIQSGPGSFVGGVNTCNTIGTTGSCTVQITSTTTGTTVVRATTTVTVGGVALTRTTGDGKAGDSADAQKIWIAPAAKISITPNATNEVGAPHTFTVKVEKDINGTGTFVAAAGEHVDFTLTNSLGAVAVLNAAASTCDNAGANTDAAGQCIIVFTSNSTGTVTGNATSTLNVSGTSLTVSTNGLNGNSGPAVKKFVNANIQITPATDTNATGTNHVLTITVNALGGTLAAGSATASIASGPGSFVGSPTCSYAGGAASASCTVTITSTTTGTTVVSATSAISVSGVTMTRTTNTAVNTAAGGSGNAQKAWVDANIKITPETATNPVGTNHTLTITVNGINGTLASGTATASIVSGPGSFVGSASCNYTGGAATASCTVVITSAVSGTTVVSATSNIGVSGQTITRTTNTAANTASGGSGNASKIWGPCVPASFVFTGNTATTGTAGNIRTFTVNGISVKVSAFSRTYSTGAWSTAYLGLYGPGLGVTDGSESGTNPSHKVDNVGSRNNYVLFEFSQPVTVDRVFLDAIGADSDMSVWIGNKTDPFNNHQTLSDAFLSSLQLNEDNLTSLSVTSRWADVNGGAVTGNILIIAAWDADDTPEDEFKISKIDIACPGTGSCPADGKFDFSGSTSTTGTTGNIRTFSVNGVSVKASAFSRNDSTNAWATSFLGLYGAGLGVTNGNESGTNPTHKVDNIGGRHDFVLFEFSTPVIVDQVFLDAIGADSDMTVWIGTKTDPFNNHQTLSDAFLSSLALKQDNNTSATVTSRWADINNGFVSGNVVVIAASTSDTTPDDEFKISKVAFKCR